MTRESLSYPAGRLHRPKVALAAALLVLAVMLAGCVEIVSLSIPTDIESPPTMKITAVVNITTDMTNIRPTIAFRYPEGWTIVSVDYAGDHTGDFLSSSTMSGYFAGTWELTVPDLSHNGHKAGYAWWAGYGGIHNLVTGDSTTVTITIQPDRTHGDFLLDFVFGIADDVSPADPSINSDGLAWEAGGTYDHDVPSAEPPGTALDQPCTLLLSADPNVLSSTPAAGATDVALTTDPKVVFSEAMDVATMTEANVFVRPAGGAALPASVFYNAATHEATVDLNSALADDTDYEIVVDQSVMDLVGYDMPADYVAAFTTKTPIAFLDVPPSHSYHDAIFGLAELGIVGGYLVSGGAEFRPANPVWRAQFAKMIDGTLSLAVFEAMPLPPFTDLGVDVLVPSAGVDNLYPHEYVAAAYDHGITTGITATTFVPYAEISRAQVVTMVVRALQALHPTLLAPPAAGFTNTWGTSFSAIHGPNARIAESNGLLDGLPLAGAANDPWAPMPRGEVAQVLWNVVQMLP